MKFDPTKPLELNMLDRPALPSDFIEETTVTMDPRPGWAPPRRRPADLQARRPGLQGALQARPALHRRPRGHPAAHDPAQSPGPRGLARQPRPGAGRRPAVQGRLPAPHVRRRAPSPALAARVQGRDYFITETYDPLPVLAVEDDAKPVVIDRHVTTWTGRRFGKNVMLDSPLATRQIEFYAIVYSPPNVDDRAPSKALEAAAKAVQMAIVAAARACRTRRSSPARPHTDPPTRGPCNDRHRAFRHILLTRDVRP